MGRSEKILKICCNIMCWVLLTFKIISNELGLEDNIKELIWLIMFIVCMVLVFISLKISKNIKKGERVLGVIVLILLVGYIIYFCLG